MSSRKNRFRPKKKKGVQASSEELTEPNASAEDEEAECIKKRLPINARDSVVYV